MQASRATHLGLFLFAASVLMLEVALTRIFSVLFWNHYTFLVISTALFGFGAAGSFLAVRRQSSEEADVRRFLSRNGLAFAVTMVISVMIVTRIGLEPVFILQELSSTLKLAVIYAVTALPFFFAGLLICRLLTVYAGQINTIYFADLVGAGAGALGVTLLLEWLGAPATILACGALACIAAAIFAGPRAGRAGLAWPAAFTAALVFVHVKDPWQVPPPISKPLHERLDKVDYSRWSLHARIDVLESEVQPLTFGSGVAREHANRPAEYRTFYMDGSNPSRLIKAGQDEWFLSHVLTAAPYQLVAPGGSVLIVGAGGGIDVKVAQHYGAGRIVALEINPATVDLVRRDFADYIGDVFTRPEVELYAEEGRHYLTLQTDEYDVLRLTGVDTRAASASGANSLDHAFLYTVEAIRDLYRHLSETGVVAISRPRGWQTERLASIVVASLEQAGLGHPADRMAVVSNGRWTDTLLKRRPFTPAEIERLSNWAQSVSLELIYDPFTPRDDSLTRLVESTPAEREQLLRGAEENLRPVTDDSPFFFEPLTLGTAVGNLAGGRLAQTPHSGYLILIVTMVQALLFSALFILLPLARRREPGSATGLGWTIAYFSLLGLGFIMAELVFIQKYTIVLGGPAYALAVGLFSILIFSGLGAYASRRIAGTRGAIYVALFVVVLALVGQGLFLRYGLARILEYGHTMRIALSILSLAPVSFVLGWPFPIGVRLLQARAPVLVPWAWASNACLTVVGSVFCLIVSMNWGFLAALGIAALCYLAAAASTAVAPLQRT